MKIFFEIPELKDDEIKTKTFEKLAGKIKKGCILFSSFDSRAGKTTIVNNLAKIFSAQGFKILVVNTDISTRYDVKTDYKVHSLGRKELTVDKLKEICKKDKYDYILIDTAPIITSFSILKLIDNIFEICDSYYYIINRKFELADWRCTAVILNNIDRPIKPYDSLIYNHFR